MATSAVLIEPWEFIDQAEEPYTARAKKVLSLPRISPEAMKQPLGLAPLSKLEELEILLQWMLWIAACMLPFISLLLLAIRPSVASVGLAIAAGLLIIWPNREWPVPPSKRLSMPLRNKKVAAAFMRYHPLRVIVEAPESFLGPAQEEGTRLFAGVPHGLFPIGFVLLGFCNFVMPWRRVRAAAASVTLRLPIWRQVSLWNGGIDVSRTTIVNTLKRKENVIVAMDGIAGMFASRKHQGKEVFLLRKRKGLVKIGLQTGSKLVPFVCFGNTKAVVPLTDRFGVMEALSRCLGISLIYPGGRGMLPVPIRTPITVVIGRELPLPAGVAPGEEPSDEMVDALHERLLDELKALYYKWSVVGGYADVDLEIV